MRLKAWTNYFLCSYRKISFEGKRISLGEWGIQIHYLGELTIFWRANLVNLIWSWSFFLFFFQIEVSGRPDMAINKSAKSKHRSQSIDLKKKKEHRTNLYLPAKLNPLSPTPFSAYLLTPLLFLLFFPLPTRPPVLAFIWLYLCSLFLFLCPSRDVRCRRRFDTKISRR